MHDIDLPIRASILRGVPSLISDVGGTNAEFLEGYGIEARLTTQNDAYVSVRVVERILEDAASRFGIPDFGLRMAARQDVHVIGPLAIAMENSLTVGDALECANRFMFVLSPALSHEVIPDPQGNAAVLGIRYAGTAAPQSIDYGLGMVHRITALVSGGEPYGLRSVQIPHPAFAPEAVYREHFGAEVAFNAPNPGVSIAEACHLHSPATSHHPDTDACRCFERWVRPPSQFAVDLCSGRFTLERCDGRSNGRARHMCVPTCRAAAAVQVRPRAG